jgi:hypothetical protein
MPTDSRLPTDAAPGTAEEIAVLAARAALELPSLFLAGDAGHTPPPHLRRAGRDDTED